MDFTGIKSFFSFTKWFFFLILIFAFAFPYFRVEILSLIYLPSMREQVKVFCSQKKNQQNFKYSKVFSLNNRSSRVLCVYENNSENILLDLQRAKNENWVIVFNRKQEFGGNFYWPYYK
jgi:hypothetical protein